MRSMFERFWKDDQECIRKNLKPEDLKKLKDVSKIADNVAKVCNICRYDERHKIFKENELYDEIVGCCLIGYGISEGESGGESSDHVQLVFLCGDKLKVLEINCSSGCVSSELLKE